MTRLRVLLVGYGRMGRMIDALADEHDVDVVDRITSKDVADPQSWPEADVAIDFSTGLYAFQAAAAFNASHSR